MSTPPPDRFSVTAAMSSARSPRAGSSLAWASIGTRTALRRCMRRGLPTTRAVYDPAPSAPGAATISASISQGTSLRA